MLNQGFFSQGFFSATYFNNYTETPTTVTYARRWGFNRGFGGPGTSNGVAVPTQPLAKG